MKNDNNNVDKIDSLIRHVVRSSPMTSPPEDFAINVAKQVNHQIKETADETWITNILITIAFIVILGVSLLSSVNLAFIFDGTPWLLVIATGSIFSLIKLFEFIFPSQLIEI